uniref:Uncharacterized protein n=1 Tax=Hemiselmis andersenii TaxID=464988 RepID=A0A6T8K786_HEMAN|mmetsp:Transcript_17243/g.39763  ORF Transcript_17243/g.39763 Transcript_17243/m.39763 type:complete len:156 (-) Transcript_17243:198-665(-)|eukprot:CAMPEP_0114144724 /NCGR_PEP_ID=MMETSP0043_2-20121206/19679_1 /TAXON_ID=464988 /ORGANISM="Hemiselmis andersenii, Strain CCMP644" /LENGTH=155 /DNA_ID=CAMNT_0001239121 /DNA_START=551 /DNA_END=1018 /DNA_ORIENTATION=-
MPIAFAAEPARPSSGHVRFEPTSGMELDEEDINMLRVNFGLLLQGCTYVSRLPIDNALASAARGSRRTAMLPQCDISGCVMDGGSVEVVVHAKEDGAGKFSASLDLFGAEVGALEVRGSVLRSGMGTPTIRDNVRCIGKRSAAMVTSDSSDWAGF